MSFELNAYKTNLSICCATNQPTKINDSIFYYTSGNKSMIAVANESEMNKKKE